MNDRLKPVLTGAVVGGLLMVALALLGVEMPFAIAWGILVIVAFAIAQPVLSESIPVWPPKRIPPRRRGSEVSRLAWSFNERTGLIGPLLVRRVRSLVSGRLARRGLDLDDPLHEREIDALLGAGVRESLSKEALKIAELERVLDAAERISLTESDALARNTDTI